MPKSVFEIGEKIGFLTIIAELPKGPHSKRRYLVRCDCGNEKAAAGDNLRPRPGGTVSCGCYWRQLICQTTHGGTQRGKKTAEYNSWLGMRQRCYDAKRSTFKYYGGRGIAVSDRWRNDFAAFLADMGTKPSPSHSIDRRDNDGDYEKKNCRWATRLEQTLNRRVPLGASGLRGVKRQKSGRWMAQITLAGRNTYLGTFDTAEEAQAAYIAALNRRNSPAKRRVKAQPQSVVAP